TAGDPRLPGDRLLLERLELAVGRLELLVHRHAFDTGCAQLFGRAYKLLYRGVRLLARRRELFLEAADHGSRVGVRGAAGRIRILLPIAQGHDQQLLVGLEIAERAYDDAARHVAAVPFHSGRVVACDLP